MKRLRSTLAAGALALSLATPAFADITVLTKDITTVPDDEILTAKVAFTIIGGRVAYKAQ